MFVNILEKLNYLFIIGNTAVLDKIKKQIVLPDNRTHLGNRLTDASHNPNLYLLDVFKYFFSQNNCKSFYLENIYFI